MRHQAVCLEPPCGSSLVVSALLMLLAVCQAGCQEPPPKGSSLAILMMHRFMLALTNRGHHRLPTFPAANLPLAIRQAGCQEPPPKGSSLATWMKSRPMLTLTNPGHHLMPAVPCRNLLVLILVPCSTPTCRCSQPARTHHHHAKMLRRIAMILIHHQCTATPLAANSFTLKLCLVMLWLPMCSNIKAKRLSALVLSVAVVVL